MSATVFASVGLTSPVGSKVPESPDDPELPESPLSGVVILTKLPLVGMLKPVGFDDQTMPLIQNN